MKIVVIGGSGLIGSKLVSKLNDQGHEVIAASPASGINTITGEGLDEALNGADIVVDVSNSPSFEPQAVLEFFETSGRNLLAAGKKAGVKHHVALSVVGTDRLQDSGYFRGKMAQENLIRKSGMPYTILRSTQFFEFAGAIAQSGTIDDEIHMSTAAVQPIASGEVVNALADVTTGKPANSIIEVAGPVRMRMDEFIGNFLVATNDQRLLIPDGNSTYYGVVLDDSSLVPGENPILGKLKYDEWFAADFVKV